MVVLFLLPFLAAAAGTLRMEDSRDAMGSVYSVAIYGDDREAMAEALEEAFAEVRRLDRMLSNYRAGSEWSRINREAAEKPVKVTPEMFRLLAACIEYSRQSEGAFDISVGPLMKVWGFYKGSGRLPAPMEIQDALEVTGYRNIVLDSENSTVRFRKPGIEIDPGGIGKGYTVDRMVEILKEKGVRSALVSASGSSIYALGKPPHEEGWRISITDPGAEDKTAGRVFLKDQSMSTSGSYEKFFRAEGRTYTHIMDPRTGYPAQGTLSVSVIGARTIDTEAWTKPFFIRGRKWTIQNKPKGFRVFFCEDKSAGNGSEQACAWLP